mgnify:CR=1 FL=1
MRKLAVPLPSPPLPPQEASSRVAAASSFPDGSIAVAVQAQRAVAYRHPADGVRSVPVWLGESAVAEGGEWVSELLAQSPEEPVLLVCADAETSTALGSFVSAEGYPGVEQITLNEALARPGPFPRYHPAQLLPRTPLFTAQRFLVAAQPVWLAQAQQHRRSGLIRWAVDVDPLSI